MDLIVLAPAILCWVALAKWPIRKVFAGVYLPILLLLPQYYIVRFPHMPPLTFAESAILPLGAALWVKEIRRWRPDWMDLWVFLLALSAGLSEGLSTALATGTWTQLFAVDRAGEIGHIANGGLMFFDSICTTVLPYMLGKLLIEQTTPGGNLPRKNVVRIFVSLLAVVATISVHDFIRGRSIWQMVGRHIFPNQLVLWDVQMRWGFGRIQGPYSQAILAGMIFLMGVIYCLWLLKFAPEWGTRRVLHGYRLQLRHAVFVAIVAGLLMTQSRGPWVGIILSLVLALLVRTFTFGKAVIAFVVLMVVFGIGASYYGKRYTDVDIMHAKDEAQQNAIYRRELLNTYMPIIKERKAFGWGITTLPKLNGQGSIDNEYLLLAATQGLFGLGMFMLVLGGSAVRLLRLGWQPLAAEDKTLVFAHLTVLMGLAASLTTVYLGEQVVPMLFIMVGWIHGMNAPRLKLGVGRADAEALRFRKVIA
jgi:uncharacterized membrane protein